MVVVVVVINVIGSVVNCSIRSLHVWQHPSFLLNFFLHNLPNVSGYFRLKSLHHPALLSIQSETLTEIFLSVFWRIEADSKIGNFKSKNTKTSFKSVII